jgi:hypothetical protein
LIRRIASSFVPLVLFTIILTVFRLKFLRYGVDVPRFTNFLSTCIWRFISIAWMYLDRQGRGLTLPFEFDALTFWAWPITLPYYLYKTRRAAGFFYCLGIYVIVLIPDAITVASVISRR